jgi:hypothetical protein
MKNSVCTRGSPKLKDFLISTVVLGPSFPGIVLALNARVLCLSPRVFDPFLSEFEGSQLLCWTGTGEPPIFRSEVEGLSEGFQQNQLGERIGFDCSYA